MDIAQVDSRGYRLSVGVVIINARHQVFWACRSDREHAWQFPQGGVHLDEPALTAMYRELFEEVGLNKSQVEILRESQQWVTYELPAGKQNIENRVVIGQRQKWFLLRLLVDDSAIDLNVSAQPEFNQWQWVEYWYPLTEVISFKQEVYKKVLTEFFEYLPK